MSRLAGPWLPPQSGAAARQLLVLLHGYGADGADLIGLAEPWRALWPDMLALAPNAPEPCAGSAFGYQWFQLDIERPTMGLAAVAQTRPVVFAYLEELWDATGLRAEDTVLCGFSQGAMVALHVAVALERPVAAVLAFSGAFVAPEGWPPQTFARPPVALIHGELDDVVDPDLSRSAARELEAFGFDVALHLSPGTGHGIAPDGLAFATAFLRERMPLKP